MVSVAAWHGQDVSGAYITWQERNHYFILAMFGRVQSCLRHQDLQDQHSNLMTE